MMMLYLVFTPLVAPRQESGYAHYAAIIVAFYSINCRALARLETALRPLNADDSYVLIKIAEW